MLFSLGLLTDLTPKLLLGENSPLQRMKMMEMKRMQEMYYYLT